MKYIFLFSWLILPLACAFAATDTIPTPLKVTVDLSPESKNWRELKNYDGRFSILSPGEMTENVDSVSTPIGTLAYHTFFFQTEDKNADNVLYMLSYCDYPPGTVHSDSTELIEELFAATLEAAQESVDGELLYERNTSYQNYPGKLWRINYLDGGALIKTKAFVIKHRLYTLQTVTHKNRSLNRSTDKFLDSFRLIGDF